MDLQSGLRVLAVVASLFLANPARSQPPGFTTLYNFTGQDGDGTYPAATLAMGKDGALYGCTGTGGAYGYGAVFELTPPATPGGPWTEKVLHSFAGSQDGAYPYSGPVLAKNGVLYGTTYYGGSGPCQGSTTGCGTVYELSPPAAPGVPMDRDRNPQFHGRGRRQFPLGYTGYRQ